MLCLRLARSRIVLSNNSKIVGIGSEKFVRGHENALIIDNKIEEVVGASEGW